jgi:ribosome-binding factor A
MSGTRKQRIQEGLRAELSDVIRREMRDPRFSEGLLSITDVDLSADYKHAVVYVSVLGDEKARVDGLKALVGASHVLRTELMKRKAFITVPELTFKYDESVERGARIFEVLERVRRDDARRAAADRDLDLQSADSPGNAAL